MAQKFRFQFYATVSDRGQIFIPKVLQNYFGIKSRDKVAFVVNEDGSIVFKKKKGENDGCKVVYP
ncbi:MAG: hypothetical protein ABIH85_00560 [Candidatus Omnitrophota bacterium]|nr:AbrB/MazE/SpoVT family DNA-binding domain-containing protein [Candidatus Omnitrophota bacterium]